jgi:predicted dehydrogenase
MIPQKAIKRGAMNRHILILGTGSVGKRHARNLHELGCTISCMDPRGDRLEEVVAAGVPVHSVYQSVEDACRRAESFDGVVVASPPRFHVDQCLAALNRRLPVLLEKPVSPDLENARRLQQEVSRSGVPLLLGYTWRWWPSLVRVRELIAQQVVGRLRHVTFTMAAHLADWHPWERYQDFFMASRELGGGALLDESHWLDLMIWYFGMPESIIARVEKLSDLEIETDDNVDMLVSYPENCLKVVLHLDLYRRPHEKSIQFVGDHGTVVWEPNQIKIGKTLEPQWEIEPFPQERNDMFVAVAREFMDVLAGRAVSSCTIADGVNVLRVVEAARRSSREGRLIVMETVR